jgi:uncharacterized protein YbjQ (UPF0145 family)
MEVTMRLSILLLASALLPGCAATLESAEPGSLAVAHGGHAGHDDDHDDDHDGDHDGDHDHAPLPTDPRTIAAAAKVTVLQNEDMSCATEALGPLDVHSSMHDTDKALGELRLRAAAIGAEAVTGVDFHHGEGGHEHTHLSGMAVRCHDLMQGRKYDLVARLDVDGKMGKEGAAFGELLTRAGRLRADMVIDIHFVHGEGGEQPTHVSGTAVRFRN